MAVASEMPPSVVALPPKADEDFAASPAQRLGDEKPVPRLVVFSGLRSGGGKPAMPEASLRPMTAVRPFPSSPHERCRDRQAASTVRAVCFRPPVRPPSPPRNLRRRRSGRSGSSSLRARPDAGPRSIARAAASAERVPLNLSGAMRTRR